MKESFTFGQGRCSVPGPCLATTSCYGLQDSYHLKKVKRERKESFSSVILEGILEKWLRENNQFEFNGSLLPPFSEGAISRSIQYLKEEEFEGLGKESQRAYELIRFGKTVELIHKGGD